MENLRTSCSHTKVSNNNFYYSQWFECRNYILLCSLIIWIKIVLRRTVVASDCWTVWNNLRRGHLQRQVEGPCKAMWFPDKLRLMMFFFFSAFAGVLYESATKNKMIACLTCLASLIRSFLLFQYMQKCIFVDTKFTLLLHCRSVTTINSITVQKICVLSSLDRLIQIKSLRLSVPLKKKLLAR